MFSLCTQVEAIACSFFGISFFVIEFWGRQIPRRFIRQYFIYVKLSRQRFYAQGLGSVALPSGALWAVVQVGDMNWVLQAGLNYVDT